MDKENLEKIIDKTNSIVDTCSDLIELELIIQEQVALLDNDSKILYLQRTKIPYATLRKYLDIFYIVDILKVYDVDTSFAESFSEFIDFNEVHNFNNLSTDFINKNIDKFDLKRLVLMKNNLDTDFLFKYADKFNIIEYYRNNVNSFTYDDFKEILDFTISSMKEMNVDNNVDFKYNDTYQDSLYSLIIKGFFEYNDKREEMTLYLLEKYSLDINFNKFMSLLLITDDILIMYLNSFDIKEIFKFKLCEINFEKLIVEKKLIISDDIFREYVSCIKGLSFEFIEQNAHKLDWNNTNFYIYSREFFTKFKDYINWSVISYPPVVSNVAIYEVNNGCENINFIESIDDLIKWEEYVPSFLLGTDFIMKYEDKLNWNKLEKTGVLKLNLLDYDLEFIERHPNMFDFSFIGSKIELLGEDGIKLISKYIKNIDITSCFSNLYVFDDEFLIKHKEYIDFDKLKKKRILSENVIEAYGYDIHKFLEDRENVCSIKEFKKDGLIKLIVAYSQYSNLTFIDTYNNKLCQGTERLGDFIKRTFTPAEANIVLKDSIDLIKFHSRNKFHSIRKRN